MHAFIMNASPTQPRPSIDPEWTDAKQTFRRFALGRTVLDRLVREKKIRSVSLKEPGMERGKRLYCVRSIREYLESRASI